MYMRVARAVAMAGTCDRAQVGSVIVRRGAILGTGFNGSASGDRHCDDVGHLMINGHCHRAIHAELNAILNAAKSGAEVYGSTMFVTHRPCYRCIQHLVNAGISRVFYGAEYGDPDRAWRSLVRDTGIAVRRIK